MSIDVHSDALLDLIAADAELTLIAEGFGFVEGPVWHPDGYLLFTDIAGNAILRWDIDNGTTTWRKPSRHANGLALRADGAVVVCEHDRSVVLCIRPDETEEIVASHFEGRELNSPNDVIVASDGSVLFTDPHPAGRTAAWGVERPQELDFNGLYHVALDGEAQAILRDLAFPNGLCLSPSEDVLYANDSVNMCVYALDIGAGWSFGEPRMFVSQGTPGSLGDDGFIVPGDPSVVGIPDGMRCDHLGNVWCTGPGGIWVVSPEGEHLGTIETPEFAANLAWGGNDGRELFITASAGLYKIDTSVCSPLAET